MADALAFSLADSLHVHVAVRRGCMDETNAAVRFVILFVTPTLYLLHWRLTVLP